MENWKRFLNEAEEKTASVEEIEKVILDVLKKEGGAAGEGPIEDALNDLEKKLPEDFDLTKLLKKMKDTIVKYHDDGDVIEMGGLNEEELEEKRFANDPKLDKDGDGVPKCADKDDNNPEVGSKKKPNEELKNRYL